MNKSIPIFGEKLAQARHAAFYSQEELSQRLGVALGSVKRLETRPISGMLLSNFRKLAEVLKMTPEALREKIGAPEGSTTTTASSSPEHRRAAWLEKFTDEPHGVVAAALDAMDLTKLHALASAIQGAIDRRSKGYSPAELARMAAELDRAAPVVKELARMAADLEQKSVPHRKRKGA